MAVYSPDRVTRLRLVLGIVIAIALLTAAFAVFILTTGEHRAAGVLAMVVGGVLLAAAGSAFTLLGAAERPAKIATVVTGLLCVLAGLALAGSWLAFLLPLVGVGLLFLALISDEVES